MKGLYLEGKVHFKELQTTIVVFLHDFIQVQQLYSDVIITVS